MSEEIRVRNNRLQMIVDGKLRASRTVNELEALYVVSHDDIAHHGDDPFYVAVFSDVVWVIPDDVYYLLAFLKAVQPALERTGKVYRARAPSRPRSWRRKWLGLLPLSPSPRLAEHPRATIPAWHARGPFRPSDIPRFHQGGLH